MNAPKKNCSWIHIFSTVDATVTTIQRVHNESVRVYVDHDEMSTTVRVFTEALDISATTQHPMTPEVVTALLHQLLEDTNLKSYVQTKLAEQHDEQAKIAALTLQGQQVTNVGFDFDNSLNMAMSAMDVFDASISKLLGQLPSPTNNELTRIGEISMQYAAEIRQTARTALVITSSIIAVQDKVVQSPRTDVVSDSEDALAAYAKTVVNAMMEQTNASTSASIASLKDSSSEAMHEPTVSNIQSVGQAAQAIVHEITHLRRTTPEKKRCDKETSVDIPTTQLSSKGSPRSEQKSTPAKQTTKQGTTRIPVSTSRQSRQSRSSVTGNDDDEDEDPKKDQNDDDNKDEGRKMTKKSESEEEEEDEVDENEVTGEEAIEVEETVDVATDQEQNVDTTVDVVTETLLATPLVPQHQSISPDIEDENDDDENASGTTSSDDIMRYINDPTLLDELDHEVRLFVEAEIDAYKVSQAELLENQRQLDEINKQIEEKRKEKLERERLSKQQQMLDRLSKKRRETEEKVAKQKRKQKKQKNS